MHLHVESDFPCDLEVIKTYLENLKQQIDKKDAQSNFSVGRQGTFLGNEDINSISELVTALNF